MSVKTINATNISADGLTIVGPSDPSFDGLMDAYLRDKPHIPSEVIKPSSLFLRNTGDRIVVAIKLKWELTKSDGTTITKEVEQSTPWILSHAVTEAQIAQADTVIHPKSTWFLSLAMPFESVDEVANNKGTETREQQQSSPNLEDEKVRQLRALNDELAQHTNITVSIDGAFFDDGTFVGPDTTGLFERVKAMVDARYDLLDEIETAGKRQKLADEAFNLVERLASQPAAADKPDSSPMSTPTSLYTETKKRFAAQIMGIKSKSQGDDGQTLRLASESVRKPRVTLRKS